MDYNILNQDVDMPPGAPPTSSDPSELSLRLQRSMLTMKGDHMTADGRGVDYEQLRGSEAFREYVSLSRQLCQCDPSSMDQAQIKAFFINVYNSLTIHGLASSQQLPSSVLEVEQFWRRTAYNIGGYVYSLDDMEHGVLRGNKRHPSASKPQFSSDDPRLKVSLKSCDPRIHFALVCGAKSCPAIQVYSAANLERALDAAARSFCGQEVEVEPGGVVTNKILHWYSGDFGTNQRELLQWLCKYLPDDKRSQLETLLAGQEDIQVQSKEYNWQLNKL